MKKILLICILAIGLSACDEQVDPRIEKALDKGQSQEEIAEDENIDQISDDSEANEDNDDEIERTYPDDKKSEVKKNVIDVESSKEKSAKEKDSDKKEKDEKDSDKKEDKKDKDKKKSDKKKKKDEKSSDKDKDAKKTSEKDDKKALTEDDYFFSYFDLVTVKDGKIVDVLEEIEGLGENYAASYVPFSNNVFVLGSYPDEDFSIRKINGQKIDLLYDFEKNESFRPIGMIGDKIYGAYSYYTDGMLDQDKSGIGEVNLKTGKVNVYEASKIAQGEAPLGEGLTDKEIYFTKLDKDMSPNLYKLDLSKGFDQEAELLEANTLVSYIGVGKYFKGGKANYEVFKSEGDKFIINDKELPALENITLNFIGQNVIVQSPVKFDKADHLFKMDIINYVTGQTIEKDLETYGYRVYNGKFYYIDYDKKVQSLDLAL